jgi:hypothetical protein
MSPIIISREAAEVEEVDSLLVGKDGKPTVEAEVIREFLEFVDWHDIFDSEEAKPYVETSTVLALDEEDGDDFVEVEEGTEGAQKLEVETLSGEVVAQLVDEDDLLAMFEHYVAAMPEDTLEDKVRKAAFVDIGEDAVDEAPFKKGAFRKMHKAGGGPQVKRMLMAMMNKEAIRRVPKKSGYLKGDYKKDPAGYGGGTAKGVKRWRTYLAKSKAKSAQAAKKAAKGKRVQAKFVAKAKGKPGAKVTVKKGAPVGKKKLTASQEVSPSNLTEGASMAGSILAIRKANTVNEDAGEKKE